MAASARARSLDADPRSDPTNFAGMKPRSPPFPCRIVLTSGTMFRFLRRILPSTPPQSPGRIHALTSNENLSQEQYARCLILVDRVQRLYDDAEGYATRYRLDRNLVFAGNEWATLVPSNGMHFRTAYNDINYLRLHAPFAGYHLLILDRLDQRQFPDSWGAEFVATMGANSIPDDIAELTAGRFNISDRLLPLVPEYLAHIKNVPSRYIVRTPGLFGEIGVEVGGALVNADVILCQSRINAMLSSGVLDKLDRDIARRGSARVLEVGPGYGSLARALKGIFGDRLEYICVDLPSSLYYASLYLSGTSDWQRCHVQLPGEPVPDRFNYLYVANYMLDEFADVPIDLALNCMSFPEMSAAQVRHYGSLFHRMLRDDGLVFDENDANKPDHTDSKAILSEIFSIRRAVRSEKFKTKDGVQDVWSR